MVMAIRYHSARQHSAVAFLFFLIVAIISIYSVSAQSPMEEDDYYRIISLPIPEGIVLEAGGLELMPDGQLAVSTRRGDIYMVDRQ